MSLLNYIVPFLVILTVLVFVHELGHYWVAKRNGVRVDVFSIGFGRELFGWTDRAGTRWKFSAIPLGGYVKMFGEMGVATDEGDEVPLTPAQKAVSFHHKTLGQRAAIVVAGPAANFIFAVLVLGVLYGLVGTGTPLSAVGQVQAGSAAERAGLQTGDLIVAVAGAPVASFEDLRTAIQSRAGVETPLAVRRDGQSLTLVAVPDAASDSGAGAKIGRLGVGPDPQQVTFQRHGPLDAAWMGVERTASLTWQILEYVGRVITGNEAADQLGGPIRIAQMSGEVSQGGLVNVLFFMAALSINLGLINLFPIPMLDGGHLAFYLYEWVRGRPLGPRALEYGFRIGLALVLSLVLFVTWNDLMHLKVFEAIRGWVG
jgi:regulator of sigma E protease